MILQETYTLANGIAIPKLGLGTWFIDNNKAAQAVRTAAELGYRLIDTAQAYGNERGVGEGIRTCGLKREELFVASKVAAEHKTYEDAARSIDETLEKMGLRIWIRCSSTLPSRGGSSGPKSDIFRRTGPSGVRWRMLRQRERCGSSASPIFCGTIWRTC